MTALLRPVTKMQCSIPASRASSTTCWRMGRSTTVSISLGTDFVAGRKRVPRPATGKTALRIFLLMKCPRKSGRAGINIHQITLRSGRIALDAYDVVDSDSLERDLSEKPDPL